MSWVLDGITVAVIIFAIIKKAGASNAGIKAVLMGFITGIVVMLIVANLFWVVVKANGNKGGFFNYDNIDKSYVFDVFVIPGEPEGEGIEGALSSGRDEVRGGLDDAESNAAEAVGF